MSSRLLNTLLFASDAGRSALSTAIANTLPFASSDIVASPPLLYPYIEGTTSVTPAWRTSLWHVSISHPNATSAVRLNIPIQLIYTNGRFLFNSTLDDRRSQYAQVDQHMQAFRDLTPGSGAYFVRLSSQDRGVLYSSSRVRMKPMCTSLIMNSRSGDPTMNDCCKSSKSSKWNLAVRRWERCSCVSNLVIPIISWIAGNAVRAVFLFESCAECSLQSGGEERMIRCIRAMFVYRQICKAEKCRGQFISLVKSGL